MKKYFFLLAVVVTACKKESQQTVRSEEETSAYSTVKNEIPDEIHFTQPGLYPEGVAFDKFNNRFLVSSFGKGTIGSVSFDGTYTAFIEDPDLKSTLGLHIDEARKRIAVAVTDGLFGNVAKVGVYDLNTGSRIWLIDLAAIHPGGIHLADDLTFDPEGNIYITDVKSPVIYKVDINGHPSVFLDDEYFGMPPGFPYPDLWTGFNGIAYDNTGFLIVSFVVGPLVGKPSLVKIPIDDPHNYTAIGLDFTPAFPDFSLDGILLSRDGKQLIGVNNAFLAAPMEIVYLTSNDHWGSANRSESFPVGFTSPTTATSDGKNIYVIYSYLFDIFFGTPGAHSEFIIKKIPFTNINSF